MTAAPAPASDAPAAAIAVVFNDRTHQFDWTDGVASGSADSWAEARMLSILRYARKVVNFQCRSASEQDREDAFQYASMMIWQLLIDETHDLHGKAVLATPAWLAGRAGMLARSYLQGERRKGARYDPMVEFDASTADPAGALIDRCDVKLLLEQVARELPPHAGHLVRVVHLMLDGKSMSQAARICGYHKTSISRQLKHILRPLVRSLLKDDAPVWDAALAVSEPPAGIVIQLSLFAPPPAQQLAA